ncbi:MAG: ATP-binding protein [Zoogloeaceae bacterium]|nr:ATP-binding protein [Zoogloeaceae bacterium]
METKYRESETDKKLRKWFTNDMSRSLLRSIGLRRGNLRGLGPFEISLDYPITAIAGRNGAGKSTILAMACCAYHNQKDGFKLKRRRNPYYTFSDFFIQHTEEIPPQGIDIYYQFAHNNWRKSDDMPDGVGLAYQRRWKRKGGKWNDYAGRVKSNVVFLGIDRIVPHSERSQSKSYSKAFKDVEPQGWESTVAQTVGFILGKKYTTLRYLEHSKYNLPIVECNGAKYSGLNMGAGENALFEIFRIIYSCGDGALLVVDEIELGLHIDAQRKLIKMLKDVCVTRKIQVICTTHSKEIFDSLPPDARKYVECVNSVTVVTEGIAPEFAMSKMGASEIKELDVLLEDGVASDVLVFSLPTTIRQRLRTVSVGSASALSRQLAAAYARKEERRIVAVFDGDQRKLEKDNLEYARSMAELTDVNFEQWFKDRITYLPGDSWPEAWLIQANKEFVSHLAHMLFVDENLLAEVLEYGLQAGKHNEFHEIANHLGLEKHQCVQALMMNIREHKPEIFNELKTAIDNALE